MKFNAPPLVAQLKIKAESQDDPTHFKQLMASGISQQQLPETFSWADETSIIQSGRMSDFKQDWIMKPIDQSQCGSCWAVSSTSVLTDRMSIAEKRRMPMLASTKVLTCSGHSSNPCDGGYASDAGKYFETTGVPSNDCLKYDSWCPPSSHKCTAPACGSDSCNDSGARTPLTLYRAVPGSTKSLQGGSVDDVIQRMKLNIYAGGPVVGSYRIFIDFLLQGTKWGWKSTNDIYIHGAYDSDDIIMRYGTDYKPTQVDISTDKNISTFLGLTGKETMSQITDIAKAKLHGIDGGHSIAIVGWGIGDAGPKYGQVPYWIVRNSWGTTWNNGGYFNIAFTNPEKNINTEVGLDYPITIDGQPYGSATTFLVTQLYHPESSAQPKVNGHKALLVIAVLVVLAILFKGRRR